MAEEFASEGVDSMLGQFSGEVLEQNSRADVMGYSGVGLGYCHSFIGFFCLVINRPAGGYT